VDRRHHAELDLITYEFVNAIADHRPGCEACQSGRSCPKVVAAIAAVVDWRQRRMLLTRAEHLRGEQDLADLACRFGVTRDELAAMRARWRAEEAEAA
jgi:hypothetical protein